MNTKQLKFDIAVIGGGPGGYPAAIKAAQLGKSVALIEAGQLGGTCLNRGCIPSKALIACADEMHRIKQSKEFGIDVGEISFNFEKMAMRKDSIVDKVRRGLEQLIAANKITVFKGFGKFVNPKTIKIQGVDNQEISAEKIIIATGSEPREMKAFPFDGKRIHDSTSLLEITTLPKKIVIVGGGVIGCEFASLYNEFGVEVIILEALERIIPMECSSVSSVLSKAFQARGIPIETGVFVEGIENKGDSVTIKIKGGRILEGEMALVAVGRKLNTDGIGLEKAGVNVFHSGLVEVDDKMETNVPGIYAVGDIASNWWLAHVASHQGLVAASNACGFLERMHYNAVPAVIYTNPEIATVGYSLDQAIKKGYHATLGAFPFQALGKAQATSHTQGFAQIVIDQTTGQILGAQVVGQEAATLIAEMGAMIANEMTLDCLTHTIHAHPTFPEVWLEAALMAAGEPLHLPPKKSKKEKNHAG